MPSNPNWVQVSAGDRHTCGLKADGTLVCWGDNTYGQASVPSNPNWVQVSAGWVHTCGLQADGTLACWGDNTYRQATVPSNPSWVQVSAGLYHTCGLKADGMLVCWGWNYDGQTTVPSNPNWVQVSVGGYHTCGLKADGTLRCWGYNEYGQAPVITLAPATLPNAMFGVAYAQNLSASSGSATPYTFSVLAGAVPPGLALNANGTWSGIPTAPGTFNFTAQAKDANNIAGTRDYALTVDRVSTTTTLVSSQNPSIVDDSVTFTANVSPVPTGGTVAFKEDGAVISGCDARPLTAGQATCATAAAHGAGPSHHRRLQRRRQLHPLQQRCALSRRLRPSRGRRRRAAHLRAASRWHARLLGLQ